MFEITPTFEEFSRLAEQGNLVPITASILADRDTPVTVFDRVRHHKYAFLLESVEHGIDSLQTGRYSFIGYSPRRVYEIRDGAAFLDTPEAARQPCEGRPLEVIRRDLARYRPVPRDDVPPFIGGAVGFLSYDIVREFERIPDENPNDLDMPDGILMMADSVIAIDHVRRRIVFVANAFVEEGGDKQAAYDLAVERLKELRRVVRRPAPTADEADRIADPLAGREEIAPRVPEFDVTALAKQLSSLPFVRSTVKEERFHEMVKEAVEYIHAGDAFQIVGSQRFHTRFTCDPFDIYRSLRDINPSPYMYYLQYGDLRLAGSSPEILVKLEGDRVQLRPIAGTRRRGADLAEDRRLGEELMADKKERAEHVMLVDLGRNDVGRVCDPGSVEVDQLMVIERYSHVMHIVSNVIGKLRPEKNAFDVLAATFPAGTLSGAPKIRAMEIIDELEPTRRGPYGGTVCYFSFNGNLDSCITIRTAVLLGHDAYVQAGGGWVADSKPDAEYMETINKARGVLRAIAQAQEGLD